MAMVIATKIPNTNKSNAIAQVVMVWRSISGGVHFCLVWPLFFFVQMLMAWVQTTTVPGLV